MVAGCGQDGSTSDAAAPAGQEAAFPVTLDSPGGKVVLDQRPERIVSLSPTATEMLFAIGAGGQVVAVDSNSNYPEEAPKTDLSAYEPNVEAIAGYKPDLVVYSDDPGELAAGLGKLGIPALQQPAATASTTPTPRSTSSARPPATWPRPASSPRPCAPRSRRSPPPAGPSGR